MDVWQALAGVGAFMKGKQMAEDRSREIQQQQDQADWMKRQRAHQEKQWAVEEERNARETKRLPMLEEMDKLNMETAKLGADAKKREFDFEYKLPAKNLSGLTNPPMAGAMMAASGMPAMAGLAPKQLTPMVPEQSVSVDRPVPYSKQVVEDKMQAQFGKMQNEIDHRQQVLELQERNADLREKQVMGGLVARGVLPGGTSVGGTTMNTPPTKNGGGKGTADAIGKLTPAQKELLKGYYVTFKNHPDPREREIAGRNIQQMLGGEVTEQYVPNQTKTGTDGGPSYEEKQLRKAYLAERQRLVSALTDAASATDEKVSPEKIKEAEQLAMLNTGYSPPSSTTQPEPTKNINPEKVDAFMRALTANVNNQIAAQQGIEDKKQRIAQAQQERKSATMQSAGIEPSSLGNAAYDEAAKIQPAAPSNPAPIAPDPSIVAPSAPIPGGKPAIMEQVIRNLGREPGLMEKKAIQQLVINGYTAEQILRKLNPATPR